MIILGVDPGTATTGFAVLKKIENNNIEVIDFGCIITKKTFSDADRLGQIHDKINEIIIKHNPKLISIESLYFFKNLKTAIPVSQAKGVVLLSASKKDIPIKEFTPLQVKMTIVGYGRADKKQVQEMIKKLLNLERFDLKEKSRKKDDAYDALGIAFCASLQN